MQNLKKIIILIVFSLYLISCSSSKEFSEYGNLEGVLIEDEIASWYGSDFHGKSTASGETYNKKLNDCRAQNVAF